MVSWVVCQVDGESQAPGEDAPAGVHDLLQLNQTDVEGIAENIAVALTIPEILRFRRVNTVFAASVKVKRIAMQYSGKVQGIIQQGKYSGKVRGIIQQPSPDAIFLPIIAVYDGDDDDVQLETLLRLQPCMMVVATSPSPRVLIHNLWFPPPMLGICPKMRKRYTHMAQLLTEVGERPLVLKCVVSSLHFWCDTCNTWDDNEDGHPDCHTSRLRWHMYSPKSIFSAGDRGVCLGEEWGN